MKYLEQVPEGFLHSRELFHDDCMILPLTDAETVAFGEWIRLLYAQEGYHKKMLFLLLIILDEVVRLRRERQTVCLNNPDNYIFDVTQYLMTHFSEPLTTGQLAQQFHVSVSKNQCRLQSGNEPDNQGFLSGTAAGAGVQDAVGNR